MSEEVPTPLQSQFSLWFHLDLTLHCTNETRQTACETEPTYVCSQYLAADI